MSVLEREQVHSMAGERDGAEIIKRREAFAYQYSTLPAYGSLAYWRVVEETDSTFALPLEVLVLSLRAAISRGDVEGRNRVMTLIIRRTQKDNEYWAANALTTLHIQANERQEVVRDLFADLYEHIMRRLLDPDRTFWEENFYHCLRFERMHVFQAFLTREGWWRKQRPGERVPRNLVESLDAALRFSGGEYHDIAIEDELAQKAMLAVELSDVSLLLLRLPEYLQPVLVLHYWEGKTEKEIATLLDITDRTVRNRLQHALHLLRDKLAQEKEGIYG
ncbi:MAG: sigma factor-like helix-turn-helix DNA-binding protein [Ktedonobacteraceae bacterium]